MRFQEKRAQKCAFPKTRRCEWDLKVISEQNYKYSKRNGDPNGKKIQMWSRERLIRPNWTRRIHFI